MRRRASRVPLLGALALAAAGCGGMKTIGGRSGNELTFAQVQAIHPGQTAAQILDAFPEPGRSRRGPSGKVEALDYAAFDAKQGKARLVLEFDEREVLVRREFTGAILKP